MGDSSDVQQVPLDPNLGRVQNNEFNTIQGMGQYTPQTQQVYYNEVGNQRNYAPQAYAGANQAAGLMGNQAQMNTANAGVFSGVPSQLNPAIAQTLQTAYDPQKALYNQNLQASVDSTNQGLANSGLQYSPYGAGVQATNTNQFNTNWLQSQLGREQTGANTISSLLSSGEGAANTANTLAGQGAQQTYEAGLLPYQTATAFNQNLANAVPYLTMNQQQQIGDYNSYYGAANTNTANATAAGNANNQYNMGLGNSIGGAFGSLFGLF